MPGLARQPLFFSLTYLSPLGYLLIAFRDTVLVDVECIYPYNPFIFYLSQMAESNLKIPCDREVPTIQ